ncbi:hypothetical protein SCATT_p01420 (plasmid) [Streptantibioticus cattleyicolor NRRL 8057 = DSM 46488]|uniref:Arylsulfotransferase n=1 Tax=Streptantibioticus cattleyicolor (strain ATCC 35852 / DSM 46488 / JCM 4925 / NBRC 14057 / NRRL 8057) TaxID=1003195 RepID=G8XE72_STREN|nr:hypothetical protein SCATT_p01420 [Streptantibioticus cattleyicolor NRRL 8057 = DSM 46488]
MASMAAGLLPAASASAAAGAAAHGSAAGALPLAPLSVTVQHADAHRGDLFVAPNGVPGRYASGVEILSPDGRHVVWSHTLPQGTQAADFRAQTYHGEPVLTWWQGTGLGALASGVDVVYDRHYRKVAEVRAGNGYTADGHEFLITRHNTALILAYAKRTADLRAIGGPADQQVIDGVVQEIDIPTGKVLFQWKAADHVPYAQSKQPLPKSATSPWDWFHINAVKEDTDGNLLIDARNTWTTYKADRRGGRVLWQLGGKHSSFTLRTAFGQKLDDAGEFFAWQHDPEPLGDGRYTVFDNESAGVANTGAGAVSELPYSRVVTFRLDPRTHRATLLRTDDQPTGLSATSQGNAQPLPGGHTLVGWGSLPYLSEFSPTGKLLFHARFPEGVNTYRAYRFDWR